MNEFLECTTEMAQECMELDPPGTVGEGALTTETCFFSAVDQIRSEMNDHLQTGWPDENTTGHQLRKVAIDFAVRRSELECEYHEALQDAGSRSRAGEAGQPFQKETNKYLALCLFNFLAGDYWRIVVHDQARGTVNQ